VTRDEILLLFEYDLWANNRILQAVSALTPEQFTRDMRGGFRSVRDTLVHIVGGEWGWIAYWKEPSPSPAFLADLWDRHDTLFTADAFPDFASVLFKWTEVEKERAEFVSGVTNESLKKAFPIGKTRVSLASLMQHMVNHSTYHRGQIALMFRQLGAVPPATDFVVFLREASREVSPGD